MSYSYILFRNNRLASPVYYAIFVTAEVVFTAGAVPNAWRNWTLGSSTRDLILWSVMCVWCASVWIFIDAACHRMPLADFAAIVNSGVTFVPIITCLIVKFGRKSERRHRVNNEADGGGGSGGSDGIVEGASCCGGRKCTSRCVDPFEAIAVIMSLTGILLVSRPSFLFHSTIDANLVPTAISSTATTAAMIPATTTTSASTMSAAASSFAYPSGGGEVVVAAAVPSGGLSAVPVLLSLFAMGNYVFFPFFASLYPDLHWSNFMVLRGATSVLLSVAYLLPSFSSLLNGDGNGIFHNDVDGDVDDDDDIHSLPVAVVNVVVSSALATLARLTSLVGSQELGRLGVGVGGLIANFILPTEIPTTALLSWAFYGEKLGAAEILGVLLIFAAIVVVSAAQIHAAVRKEEDARIEEEEEGEEEDEAEEEEES